MELNSTQPSSSYLPTFLYLPCPGWECSFPCFPIHCSWLLLLLLPLPHPPGTALLFVPASGCPGAALACCFLVNSTVVFLCNANCLTGERKESKEGNIHRRMPAGAFPPFQFSFRFPGCMLLLFSQRIQFEVLCVQLLID